MEGCLHPASGWNTTSLSCFHCNFITRLSPHPAHYLTVRQYLYIPSDNRWVTSQGDQSIPRPRIGKKYCSLLNPCRLVLTTGKLIPKHSRYSPICRPVQRILNVSSVCYILEPIGHRCLYNQHTWSTYPELLIKWAPVTGSSKVFKRRADKIQSLGLRLD